MSARSISDESERATKHWRPPPGGRTPNSSRKTPVYPPSAAIETIAEIFTGYFLSPERSIKLPVPPPIVTMLFINLLLTTNYLRIYEFLKPLPFFFLLARGGGKGGYSYIRKGS